MRRVDTEYKTQTNLDRRLAGNGLELQQPDVLVHLVNGAHDDPMQRLFTSHALISTCISNPPQVPRRRGRRTSSRGSCAVLAR